ncbi:MAG: GGDEF domain-containing protein, partial [Defluviitaleaceae bacterium]|nr:GGDEF domain-containing protein [Defluviitaleaceae bacterium]
MNDSVQKLISYINNVINTPYKAALEVTEMPAELVELAATLKYFGDCVIETHAFAAAMAQGNMDGAIPPIGNRVANPLRILHSALKKMTSTAEEKLASELADINDKKSSIEKYNLFISSLIQYIPQQILVLGKYNGAVLLMNEMAIMEMYSDTDYIKKITTIMSKHTITEDMPEVEVVYPGIEGNKTLLVRSYELEWEGTSAVIYAISDISETKQLEIYAYHDSLTHLYNRTYGMKKLEEWVETKKHFVLLYADLDGLKRVNDEFGHNEGDAYIINASKHLLAFPEK